MRIALVVFSLMQLCLGFIQSQTDGQFTIFPRANGIEQEDVLRERLNKVFGDKKKRSGFESKQDGSYSKRTVAQGPITFSLHQFSGDFKNFLWNSEDLSEIILHIGPNVYLSENNGENFTSLATSLEDFNTNYDKTWGPNSGGYGVRSVHRSSTNNNIIILTGKSNHFWISRDGGNNFNKVLTTKADSSPIFLQSISFHPRSERTMMASHIESHCFDDVREDNEGICSTQLYYSGNYGTTWELVSTHVRTAYWGKKGTHENYKDVIYYLASVKRDRDQFQSNSNGITVFYTVQMGLTAYDFGTKTYTELHQFVDELVVSGLYIYIQSKKPSGSRYVYAVEVSYGGNEFKVTHFDGEELRRYTFMDFSESTVVVIDSPPAASQTYSDYQGDVWFSDPSGVYFVRSLQKLVVVNYGFSSDYDFHKIKSLEGTYMANSVGQHGALRTRISSNRGGSWFNVQSKEGTDGLIDETQHPFLLLGELHSTISGTHNGFHSQKSAPGSVISIGKHDINLIEYITGKVNDGDVYYSRNGGRVFTKILEGRHYCKLLDEGNIIVCVSGNTEGTNKIKYTMDSGKTWNEAIFSEYMVDVAWIYADPSSLGLSCIIEAVKDGDLLLIAFNLSPLGLPDCTESDYEHWYPSDSNNGRLCVLGHRTTYKRPSESSVCFSSLTEFISEVVDCPCSDEDFSCDYGYFYNNTGKICSPEKGTAVDQINCQEGYYFKDLHYRKTPGNTCNVTLQGSVDLEEPVKEECPIIDLINSRDKNHALAVGLGVGLTFAFVLIASAIAFVVWSKRRGYLHYRLVATNDAGTDANAGMERFDDIHDGGNDFESK